MDINYSVLNSDEKAIFKMRSLYKKYGYSQYKMSKFEEYDLYVRNKDFLVSENIITFTDTDGKLMALKPDVTLSIIKNSEYKEGQIQKLFYDENVYRVSNGTHSFKEIMQVGLECIGDIDTYNIFEVIMLAAKSLEGISKSYVLDISNMDIISDILASLNIDDKARKSIVKCIGEKNSHEITDICRENNVDEATCESLKRMVSLHGSLDDVLSEIKSMALPQSADAVEKLEQIVKLIKRAGFAEKVRIDFSVISDTNYYNGFVFKGFIEGISTWVLSGGQYDNLMNKMHLKSGAVGFAVYLDVLEGFEGNLDEYDVDAVILYKSGTAAEDINNAMNLLMSNGKSVLASRVIPVNIKYRQIYKLSENGGEIIEYNA